MASEQEEDNIVQAVLSNGLILEKIVSLLPHRQFLGCRLISRHWDDAVRRSIPSRIRVDLSYCTMQKKAEDKKKSELEEKLDLIVYLRISHLVIGIEDNTPPLVLQSFEEIGPNLTQLTLKLNLEKDEDFTKLACILESSPNLQEFIWWGLVNEGCCHKFERVLSSSVKRLALGFYSGEVENMGKRAMAWIASVFPNVEAFTCLPHHREGLIRYLLSNWGEGTPCFPNLNEVNLHLMLREGEGLGPLEVLPTGLKVLELTLNGKRETGSVQIFEQTDALALSVVLAKQAPTLEKLTVRLLNLWKPKPLVEVELPRFPNLRNFAVTGDFSEDLSIDFRPSPNQTFPKLAKLSLPYLWGAALGRFLSNSDDWSCGKLRVLDFKVKEKLSNVWLRNQSAEWVESFVNKCQTCFPAAEFLDAAELQKLIEMKKELQCKSLLGKV